MSLHNLLLSISKQRSTPQPGPSQSAASANQKLSGAPSPLVPCVYIALQCPRCAEIRQALNATPIAETVPCPECGTESKFVLLGAGFTRSQLPFHENYSRERMHWVLRDLVQLEYSP